jgi:flagellar FliL protein
MSDSEELNLEGGEAAAGEEGAEGDGKKKAGGLKALLPTILKFAAIGLGALIFIVTVVVITFNILNKGGAAQAVAVTDPTSAYEGTRTEYQWYINLGAVTTRTRDANVSVTVDMIIGYDIENVAAAQEFGARQYELRDFVRRFFSGKTAADLQPENEARLKQEIQEILNTQILDKVRARRILFNKLDVMEM